MIVWRERRKEGKKERRKEGKKERKVRGCFGGRGEERMGWVGLVL